MARIHTVGQYFVVNEPKAGWQFIGKITEVSNEQCSYEVVRGLHPSLQDDDRHFAIGSLWDIDMVKFIDAKTAETLYA